MFKSHYWVIIAIEVEFPAGRQRSAFEIWIEKICVE
jgi:hypothetical protein